MDTPLLDAAQRQSARAGSASQETGAKVALILGALLILALQRWVLDTCQVLPGVDPRV